MPGTGETGTGETDTGETDAADAVTALYRDHALGLTRLAFVMLGDRQAAEDVVQEAFCSVYLAWGRLPEHDRVLGYLRVSVLNGCRSAIRRRKRMPPALAALPVPSAETDAMIGEEQREAAVALRQLPARQREVLVLRYYAELPELEIAQVMGISRGTVASTTARALAALGRRLKEDQ